MHKFTIKLFLQDGHSPKHGEIVPVFHSWIQSHAVADHLVIDVADYEHVPNGPGTVLVTHEANFYLDNTAGQPGLVYQRKQPLQGTLPEAMEISLRYAIEAATRLETYPGLKFRTDEISFKIADRLAAPNSAETFAELKPAFETLAKSVFPGGDWKLVT